VVMLTTSYPRFPGDGVGTFMEPIARGVAARGHEVHIVAPWHPLIRRPDERDVRFHFFRYAPIRALNVFGYAAALKADVALRPAAYLAALQEHGAEFEFIRPGRFGRIVNGLNRLPRPVLAFGIVGLFVYAMVDPVGFAQRMVGLAYVPEPLWWLLGAVVSFYFGAREAHYLRMKTALPKPPDALATPPVEENAALSAWRLLKKQDE